ncbi:MAG: hydrogenase expression/formation protein HypE [Hyphomicrobiaceae bacterium]
MLDDRFIRLAHGNGGRFMRELIAEVFRANLDSAALDVTCDAAAAPLPAGVAFVSTDAFTVQPLEFPGGDIGSLAVNGTVNDIAVSGATPHYLTLAAIIEEGLDVALLARIVASAGRAARDAGVKIIAGDTKVVPRGTGGGLYLTTTGVGIRAPDLTLGLSCIRAGDAILVSGPVGDHGTAVMLAREDFDLKGDVRSDCASVLPLTRVLTQREGVRFMRDPTRGGLNSVVHEIAQATGHDLVLDEAAVPVRDAVRSVCDILGYDPYQLACEGRIVAVVAPDVAAAALSLWQATHGGHDAAIIGHVADGRGRVVLRTTAGGERLLAELEDDPLPRIC